MKFSIVIPTYNREKDLRKCLDYILLQTTLPAEIIIVDDGALLDNFIDKCREESIIKNINFVYYKKNHEIEERGSSESRNKALDIISSEIFFILDDDVILEPDFCEKIVAVWNNKQSDNSLIGIGGIIKNRRKISFFEKYFYIFFGISSKYSWDVNKVGFQIWDEEIQELSVGYYAHGGACSYKLDKSIELKFSTFSNGRTALEDVDFCLRAKNKGYYFLIEPNARLYHYPSSTSREGNFLMGYKESANRRLIFKSLYKKPSHFLWLWFYWSNFGWILKQFLVGNFRKGWGMVKGIFS